MSGLATQPADYSLSVGGTPISPDGSGKFTVTFPKGTAELFVQLVPVPDAQNDGVENATLASQAVADGTYWVGANGSADVYIYVSSPVTVTAQAHPSEVGAIGRVRVSRTGHLYWPVTVAFTPGGTAVSGIDYTVGQGSGGVVLDVGVAQADIEFLPIQDSRVEGTETITVNLQPGWGYVLGTPNSATVNLTDNDAVNAPGGYSFQEIPALVAVPYALNNASPNPYVVGAYCPWSNPDTNYYPRQLGYRWTLGSFTQIGPITTGYMMPFESAACGINNSGLVVGWSDCSQISITIPIYWQNGTCYPLDEPPGFWGYSDWDSANAVNDNGVIVGTELNYYNKPRAVRWDSTTTRGVDLGSMTAVQLPTWAAYGNGISPNGRVVGTAQLDTGVSHAFRTRAQDSDELKTYSDLGSIAGAGQSSEAWGINSLDEVAGGTKISSTQTRGFIKLGPNVDLTLTGGVDPGMIALAALPSGTWSKAYGINTKGYVVGQSYVPGLTPQMRAVVWRNDGTVVDLASSTPF